MVRLRVEQKRQEVGVPQFLPNDTDGLEDIESIK
jgi:hypothetical protein